MNCACIGPQNGNTLCPCRMLAVVQDRHYGTPCEQVRHQQEVAALQARAEAAEAAVKILAEAITPFGNAHFPAEREQLGDSHFNDAMEAMLAGWKFLRPDTAIDALGGGDE